MYIIIESFTPSAPLIQRILVKIYSGNRQIDVNRLTSKEAYSTTDRCSWSTGDPTQVAML